MCPNARIDNREVQPLGETAKGSARSGSLVALFDFSAAPNFVLVREHLDCIARRAKLEFFVVHREVSSSAGTRLTAEGLWPKLAEQSVLAWLNKMLG
jgi:hypothetical protein